jgi:hypothetical protein
LLCDMRPGFSEDGVVCALPKGNYKLSIEPTQDRKMHGFSLVLVGENATSERNQGTFSLDMARVGVFERKPFLALFDGDSEALSDWTERAADKKSSAWGGFIHHKKSGLQALYVNIGSDCRCLVQLLRAGKRVVGVRVIPTTTSERSPDQPGSRHWTWVELKCEGISKPLSFCDDRDYDPDFDLLLDNVRFEVSSIDENGCLEPDTIDPDIPVSRYRRRYKGVAKVTVFGERAGEPRRRIRLAKTSFPNLGSQATPRRIAQVVFDIFKHVRQLA